MKKAICTSLLGLCVASCSLLERADAPPTPIGPTPTQAQIDWQRMETYAFIHFGLNTYNDLEWGYGNTPASTFAPDTLDVEQWVSTLKRAGMKGVILTAKHHDGFCLWPTKTTDYSVKSSPWQGGKGDLVRDLSDACHRHGLKFGLYLSPWDRNNAYYGFPEYQKIFHEQIRELATGYGELFEYWFDGANGGTGWYGGADSARSIDPKSYYGYHEAGDILRANNPNIMIFGGTEPTIRWVGNERGWAGETNYSAYDEERAAHHSQAQWGMSDATKWLPAEVDVSIRPGWFYHHREDHQVRSVADLTNLYYQSVGRNATLLLNCPINLEGKIPATDSANLIAWHEHIQKSFESNLLRNASVKADGTRRGKVYAPSNLVDNDDTTYWATVDSLSSADLTIALKEAKAINNILLQEYIALGQRVEAFSLETKDKQGNWQPIQTTDSLTTIGYKRIIRFKTVTTDAIRLRITKAKGPVCLAEAGAYLAPVLIETPEVYRDHNDMLHIKTSSDELMVKYHLSDGAWQDYTQPVVLSGDLIDVEVQVNDPVGGASIQHKASFGYSAKQIKLQGLSEEQQSKLIDGSGYTAITLPNKANSINIELGTPKPIRKLVYTPDQRRDADGHIQCYRLLIDGKAVAEGEFSNIKHNPIPVSIELSEPIVGKSIRLIVTKTVEDKPYVSIGDLAVF